VPVIGAEDAKAAWRPKPRIPVRLTDNFINFMVMGELLRRGEKAWGRRARARRQGEDCWCARSNMPVCLFLFCGVLRGSGHLVISIRG
jgi:hypothetical protein